VVTEAVLTSTGEPVPAGQQSSVQTLSDLFETAERALATRGAKVLFQTDSDLGYLQRLYIDYIAQAVDDEVNYQVTEFKAL
jgi:hypothetical protein